MNSPSRVPRSITDITVSRVQSLERRLARIERDGASKARGGARISTLEFEGDGTATSFDIYHPFASRSVVVSIYETDSPYQVQDLTYKNTDEEKVEAIFGSAPADGKSFTAIIIG